MSEHTIETQGWRFEESTKTIRAVPSNHWIATMDSWDSAVDHKKNAQLIAAAPELLDALYDCLEIVQDEYDADDAPEDIPSWTRAIAKARAAILKVTGETV